MSDVMMMVVFTIVVHSGLTTYAINTNDATETQLLATYMGTYSNALPLYVPPTFGRASHEKLKKKDSGLS